MPFAVRSCELLILMMLFSCGPAARDGGFNSANPAAKMYAIEYAACNGDRSAIGHIIEQLDSDDPAVRCLAIAGLKRLTGQTYGYHDYDSRDQRRQAIDRWVQALQSGQLAVNPVGSGDIADDEHSPAPVSGQTPRPVETATPNPHG